MITYQNIPHIEELIEHTENILPTGSYFMCDPPSLDTDYDFVVYTHLTKFSSLEEKLLKFGYQCSYRKPANTDFIIDILKEQDEVEYFTLENDFVSFRHGKFNLIITTSKDFYTKFSLATIICKSLNLMDKADRIVLFSGFLNRVCLNKEVVKAKLEKKPEVKV